MLNGSFDLIINIAEEKYIIAREAKSECSHSTAGVCKYKPAINPLMMI